MAAIISAGAGGWVLRPRHGTAASRKTASLATTIPPVGAAAAAVVSLAAGRWYISPVPAVFFMAGLTLTAINILVLAGLLAARRTETAKGVGFGICASIVAYAIEIEAMALFGEW